MSETQWKQFVQLFAEKNQHLSHQQVLQMAKKPFQQLQKLFSQRGGAKRHFTIQSMIRDDIEVDIDAKLTVGDLKGLIAAESGLEKDRQKLIHWTEGWRDGAFEVLENSTKLKSIPEVTRLDLMLGAGMCRIVSIENVILHGKNASDEQKCRLWTFELENGKEFKVYRTDRPKNGLINYLVQLKSGRIGHYSNIYNIIAFAGPDFGVTPRDEFIIERSLIAHDDLMARNDMKNIERSEPLPKINGERTVLPVLCTCGNILILNETARMQMRNHLTTKTHKDGKGKDKEFVDYALAYVSEFTP